MGGALCASSSFQAVWVTLCGAQCGPPHTQAHLPGHTRCGKVQKGGKLRLGSLGTDLPAKGLVRGGSQLSLRNTKNLLAGHRSEARGPPLPSAQ